MTKASSSLVKGCSFAKSCHSNNFVRATLPCPGGGLDELLLLGSSGGWFSGRGRLTAVLVVLAAAALSHHCFMKKFCFSGAVGVWTVTLPGSVLVTLAGFSALAGFSVTLRGTTGA